MVHIQTCSQNTYTHKNITNLNFFKFNFSGLGDTSWEEHLPPVSKSLGSTPASFKKKEKSTSQIVHILKSTVYKKINEATIDSSATISHVQGLLVHATFGLCSAGEGPPGFSNIRQALSLPYELIFLVSSP